MNNTILSDFPSTFEDTKEYLFDDPTFWKPPICNLIVGDVFKSLMKLPAYSINTVMFSPPYFGQRDYGMKEQIGLEDHPDKFINKLVEVCKLLKIVLKREGSLWINIGDSYFGHHGGGPSKFERESKGLTWKDKSSKYRTRPFDHVKIQGWVKSKQLMLIPSRLAIALQEDGWILRNDAIWKKDNPMPESVKDRLSNTYEHIFHFVKQKKYYYNLDSIRIPYKVKTSLIKEKRVNELIKKISDIAISIRGSGYKGKSAVQKSWSVVSYIKACREALKILIKKENLTENEIKMLKNYVHNHAGHPLGKNPGDVWSISTKSSRMKHYAVYPEELCSIPIKSTCPPNGIILDPFSGSGTTLKVARDLDRNAIGIDLNPKYIEIAKQRLTKDGYKVKIYV